MLPLAQAAAEFAAETTYLNTASIGLPPARTLRALRAAEDQWATGQASAADYDEAVDSARASFARLIHADVESVAIGPAVSAQVGLIAAALPAGSDVVLIAGDFSSVIQPLAGRHDLSIRIVDAQAVAHELRPHTALVAFSAVQSADGRVIDLDSVRAAAAEYGTLTLLDATQAAGWLPLRAGDWDYLVCHTYKWLLSPRGASFLAISDRGRRQLQPWYSGWYAADDPWDGLYGPVRLASSARRFDLSPAWLSFVGAAHSLTLVEEVGIDQIHTHNLALADRFRSGLADHDQQTTSTPSAIVSSPGMIDRAARLAAANVRLTTRAGALRASFHLYNTTADVDRTLDALLD